jgi:superfamily II DNA or RNA helicase/diadenosine tetraphosphate (Ap4A) HIT family hydrolase/HKD family nuclease/SOS-response transcriptional repressor LexA
MTSPFASIPPELHIAANELAFAVFDQFPVSPGHALVITRRIVPTWFDASPAEQAAVLELVNTVRNHLQSSLQPTPDGYNIGFNCGTAAGQTVPHLHVHIIPRYHGDQADPRGGIRNVIPELGNYLRDAALAPRAGTAPAIAPEMLSTGHPDSPLWELLALRVAAATHVDILAAFVQRSGLEVIEQQLLAALARGAHIRIIVSDYLGISDPQALRRLLTWQHLGAADTSPPEQTRPVETDAADIAPELLPGTLEARLVLTSELQSGPASFHPKAWLIQEHQDACLVVGSSNLSRPALQTGVEWNLLASDRTVPTAAARFRRSFQQLWQQSVPLSPDVISRYSQWVQQQGSQWSELCESQRDSTPALTPRPWQQQALLKLQEVRERGYQRALVAVATGMGKTWLAALDVLQVGHMLGRRPRVLVVAHRAQILAQAEAAVSAVLDAHYPPAASGWFVGTQQDLDCELVVASVQKLSRPQHLTRLESLDFDYAIIDEVHHAQTPTWRRVLASLRAGFVLGLTATPERTDGVDVATLFDDHLAWQAGIGDGIAEESLVPFHYLGLRDTVNFEQIPWRNGRFDPEQLEAAVARSERMERLWTAWQQHPAARTIVFCCSRRHAVFVRDWLLARGETAVAVFSGGGSDPIGQSLQDLRDGRLRVLCAVDLFNEGLDLPAVDRVVMLRPTESKVVFLQQLGRGLRVAPGKTRLLVLDFVGNHRVFAQRLLHLLALSGPRADWNTVRQYLQTGQAELPPGCLLDVELAAQDVLRELLPQGAAAAVDGYRRLRDELGRRPTATEVFRAGYLPRTIAAAQGAWFAFVQSEQDLMEREAAVVTAAADWFRMLETTSLNRSYKLIVLRVLLDRGALVSGLPLATLCADCRRYLQQHEVLRRDVTGGGVAVDVDTATAQAWQQWWQKWPVSRWLDEQDGRRWFEQSGDVFRWSGEVPAGLETELQRMTGELVDWRLAAYCRSRGLERGSAEQGAVRFECRVSHASGRAILFVPSVNQSPGRPTGPTDVVLPDGQLWVFKFVKVAVNVAGPPGPAGVEQNQLSDLLRGWFGADAGLPGTDFRVRFELRDGQWSISPVLESAQQGAPAVAVPALALPAGMRQTISAGRRYRDYLPAWDLAASAGFWSAEQQPEERGGVRVEGMSLKAGMFVGQVCGHSMEPQIADGAWCVFRPCPAGSREGRLLLVQLRTGVSDDAAGRFTVKRYHSEGSVTAEGWEHRVIQLQPLNSDYPVINLQPEDSEDLRIIGEFVRVL